MSHFPGVGDVQLSVRNVWAGRPSLLNRFAQRCCSANHKYWTTREIGICDACHAIGDAWACRQKSNARGTRAFCPALCGVYRCLLVPRVHDPNTLT